MKKYLKLPIIVLFLFVAQACSDDDGASTPEPPTVADMLIGKWLLVSHTINGTTSTPANQCEEKTFIRFDRDGTYEQVFFFLDSPENCRGDYGNADYVLSADNNAVIFTFEGSTEALVLPIVSISPEEFLLGTEESMSNFKKEEVLETE